MKKLFLFLALGAGLGVSTPAAPTTPISNAVLQGTTSVPDTAIFEIKNQTAAPAAGTAAGRLYFDATNRLAWKGTNGFVNVFDLTANAAGRTYTFPDLSGTVALTTGTVTNATNAANIAITDDTATNATMFLAWVTANTGNLPAKVTSTKLGFNPATGNMAVSGITVGPGATSLATNTALGSGALAAAGDTGGFNVAVGVSALAANTTAGNGVAIGYQALQAHLTGNSNIAIGRGVLGADTGGANNIAIGSMANNLTGSDNTVVGAGAMNASAGADGQNTVLGRSALSSLNGGGTNTVVGYLAAQNNVTGSRLVALGANAGKYELGSDAFYVDNQDRTNTAGDKAKALLYGTFNATAASQTLAINAGTVTSIGTFSAATGIVNGSGTAANSNNGLAQNFRGGFATAGQTPSATVRTYVTGSDAGPFTAGQLVVGTKIHWHLDITKTGAGSATATFDIAFGTAGTTADPAQVSFTKPAGTAQADHASVDVYATVKTASASGVVVGDFSMLVDQTSATLGGFLAAAKYVSSLTATSGTFNTTTATHVGLCVTTGASDAWTINSVQAWTSNL